MKVVNDIIAIRMLGKEPQMGAVKTLLINNTDDLQLRDIGMEEIRKVVGGDKFHIKEKRI